MSVPILILSGKKQGAVLSRTGGNFNLCHDGLKIDKSGQPKILHWDTLLVLWGFEVTKI